MTLLSGILAPLLYTLIIVSAVWWPIMPHYYWLIPTSLMSLAFIIKRQLVIGLAFTAMSVALIQGNLLKHQSEVLYRFGTDINIKAQVDSYFKKISHGYEVEVTIFAIDELELDYFARPKVKLRLPVALDIGAVVSAEVKLSPVFGVLNYVGFDKEKFYLSKGLVGEIAISPQSHFIVESHSHWRAQLHNAVTRHTSDSQYRGYYLALIFGDRSQLKPNDWQMLKQSGLSHLIAISGLHIGMVFVVGFVLVRAIAQWLGWLLPRRWRHLLSLQRHWLSALAGLALALTYAALGNFAVSTVRALVMLMVVYGLSVSQRRLPSMLIVLITACVVVTAVPFSAASSGFWLSFLAVVSLMISATLTQSYFGIRAMLLTHLALTLLFVPIVLYLFQGIASLTPIYNFVFVPWFSFLVVPLLMAAMVFTALGLPCGPLWWLLDTVMVPFENAISLANAFWVALPVDYAVYAIPVLIALALGQVVTKQWCFILLIVTVFGAQLRSISRSFSVHFLDVGHGLSVVIQQGREAVVYDTGRAREHFSMASAVVTPNLYGLGIAHLEGLIVSHADNDHSGGEQVLIEGWRPKWVRKPDKTLGSEPCIRGQKWHWRRVTFEALWPPKPVSRAYNPHSCVVLVTFHWKGGEERVLLTGDIEKMSEILIGRQLEPFTLSVLSVPHHGSSTSSSEYLRQVLIAENAVASTQYNSRWKLPNPKVRESYQQQGINWYETGRDGAVSLRFIDGEMTVSTLRTQNLDPWYRQMLRSRVE
ncbi:DNA internalization-related competence protein ComEC/Rec2 [Vibrio parahaemolyticus]|uniref:DNA internalization-related competence protein ComEC/Rec2 n=1 Tax=Vibrio mediterranei TaxID=689 RepID=UPI0040688DBC